MEKQLEGKIIGDQKLVSLFGTVHQKESYKTKQKLTKQQRHSILQRGLQYCEIETLTEKKIIRSPTKKDPEHTKEIKVCKYKINKIYEEIIPYYIVPMLNSLYQYSIPLILQFLIDDSNRNNRINLTIGRWAREISMVNGNYANIRRNKKEYLQTTLLKSLSADKKKLDDFYEKSDAMISYYIKNSLDYLKKSGHILYNKVFMTHFPNYEQEDRRATEEEIEFYASCIKKADSAAHTHTDKQRFYSNKSSIFKAALSKELMKRNIEHFYSTYEVYYISKIRCRELFKYFEDAKTEEIIHHFNESYTQKLIDNAIVRYSPEKYEDFKTAEDYGEYYGGMCDIVIKTKGEKT